MTKESPRGAFLGQLRQLREVLGMTVETVAAMAELTPSALRAVESGEREPSVRELLALEEALGIEPMTLLCYSNERSLIAAVVEYYVDQVPPEVQAMVLRYLRAPMKLPQA
jgi:transcriptional regulator with XRE-family HTH domain